MNQAELRKEIYRLARRIPAGCVATYGQLAALAGHPRCARFAGTCMRTCNEPGVPCHRVVFSDGAICKGDAFGGIPMAQRAMLEAEGVCFRENGKVDLQRCRYSFL